MMKTLTNNFSSFVGFELPPPNGEDDADECKHEGAETIRSQ